MLRRLMFLLVGLGLLGLPAVARAEGCANEQLRQQDAYSLGLPDCRAYEQATPTNKNGVSVEGGELDSVQASSTGESVSFFANSGLSLEGVSGSGDFPTYVAGRDPGGSGWSTHGVLPTTQPAASPEVRGFSPDLAQTLVFARLVGDSGSNLYLRDNASGAVQRLVPGGFGYAIVAFTADHSHLFFESPEQLLPSAAAGVVNLYELNHGNLTLAGVLPDGSTPVGGSFAGPYLWDGNDPSHGGASFGMYTQGSVSTDGSRAFFTAGGSAQFYLRQNGATTVQVSASQRAVPDPNGPRPAAFMAATPDGSRVFFTSCQKLTNDSTAVSTATPSCMESGQSQDLYRYDVSSGALTDLTVDSTPGDLLGAAVQGVLGAGEGADGSYVYFVANGVLATGASPGSCQGVQEERACNLYVWHNGTVSFITRLVNGSLVNPGDALNWQPAAGSGSSTGRSFRERPSRVSADGKILLFGSNSQLTGYDNHGFEEFYRYDAAAGSFACVSCNPTGAPPTGDAKLQKAPGASIVSPSGPSGVLTRNLSVDGTRVFFDTSDALVPSDTNGTEDVYEWEANGAGTCANAGGCLYLISGGTSADRSYFADASASGDNVLFFTSQPLVGQDQDGLVDIYDARVGGGIAAQNPPPSTFCSGEGCRPPLAGSLPDQVPGSESFSGPGNPTPALAARKPRARAGRLAAALRACTRKPRRRRASCRAQVRKRYGSASRINRINRTNHNQGLGK